MYSNTPMFPLLAKEVTGIGNFGERDVCGLALLETVDSVSVLRASGAE